MPEYDYEVIDRNGRLVKGRSQAATVVDLVRGLSGEGHTVVDVGERRVAARGWFRRGSRPQDQLVSLHEIATLLESGVSLGDAVEAQASGSRHPEIAAAFQLVATALTRGQSFHEALRGGGLALPAYVYHLVEGGELSGHLARALGQSVEQMQYEQRVAADLRSALLYPSILTLSGTAAVLLVFVFVIPQFSNLLENGRDLPLLAEAVLRTGAWFNRNGWLAAAVVAIAGAAVAIGSRRAQFRQRARDGLAALPLLGEWFAEIDTARWASLMSAMLTSRVALMDALNLASRSVSVTRRKMTLEQAARDVRGGASLSDALEKRNALTPTGYNLVRAGERSGQLAPMLRALASLYEANRQRRTKRFLALIEPVAVVLIGGVLGVIMVGIILAITSFNDISP